ncbi:MAG: sigma-E processing peptidase SpoIIGA [Emergencia sp.]
MVIYGEYLFLENFITGVVILYFTGKFLGKDMGVLRLVLCGVLCGICAFSLFLPVGSGGAVAVKIGFPCLVCAIAFGFTSAKKFAVSICAFLAVTFLFGGITIAFLGAFRLNGICGLGGVYLPGVTYLTVTAASTAAVLMIVLLGDLIKSRRAVERTHVAVTISLENHRFSLKGFIDSGNFLKEPLSGRPVAVVSRQVIEKILRDIEGNMETRYTVIPYRSVGVERGVLEGYRMDTLTAEGRVIKRPILAVAEGNCFFNGENEEDQILLPESMLERGIYAEMD